MFKFPNPGRPGNQPGGWLFKKNPVTDQKAEPKNSCMDGGLEPRNEASFESYVGHQNETRPSARGAKGCARSR